jgi:hypothetical protein
MFKVRSRARVPKAMRCAIVGDRATAMTHRASSTASAACSSPLANRSTKPASWTFRARPVPSQTVATDRRTSSITRGSEKNIEPRHPPPSRETASPSWRIHRDSSLATSSTVSRSSRACFPAFAITASGSQTLAKTACSSLISTSPRKSLASSQSSSSAGGS